MQKKPYVSPILETLRQTSAEENLAEAARCAARYADGADARRVFPSPESLAGLSAFDEPLPDGPRPPLKILEMADRCGSPATVAQSGGRYFGFVCGGILPSALCARPLFDAWDQNTAMYAMSPVGAKLEEVCQRWLWELLELPEGTAAGFVSGSSTAITACLLAARNELLARQGWDAGANGLAGGPKLHVVVSEEAHSTVYRALSALGLGYAAVTRVPADEQGRIRVDRIPPMDASTLLILQAGNVNSGAFDDFNSICPMAREAGAWIHVDGAFGLWAAASPRLRHLTQGMELADSWSTDGHKTLNTPYDCGVLLCRRPETLVRAMHMTGGYIQLTEDHRDSMLYTMEMSRRARAADLWATLSGLGREGVAQLVDELCAKAAHFAELLRSAGFSIENEVVYNQVLARWRDDAATERLIAAIQDSGVLWLGGSRWHGKTVMRISVCSYRTTYADIDRCAAEMHRLAETL